MVITHPFIETKRSVPCSSHTTIGNYYTPILFVPSQFFYVVGCDDSKHINTLNITFYKTIAFISFWLVGGSILNSPNS
jgi:hypothetical protein